MTKYKKKRRKKNIKEKIIRNNLVKIAKRKNI